MGLGREVILVWIWKIKNKKNLRDGYTTPVLSEWFFSSYGNPGFLGNATRMKSMNLAYSFLLSHSYGQKITKMETILHLSAQL